MKLKFQLSLIVLMLLITNNLLAENKHTIFVALSSFHKHLI
ncbi:hypothetical protein M2138_000061 [Dysgonomonadaceae bacterium PH5-43]|nr:hypothetical protein [Dysgonomonadaceae bacterium PH5-43]